MEGLRQVHIAKATGTGDAGEPPAPLFSRILSIPSILVPICIPFRIKGSRSCHSQGFQIVAPRGQQRFLARADPAAADQGFIAAL